MNAHAEDWALIPSDPAVFEDMVQQYGIEEVRVEEIFALEFLDESKDNTDLHGLIFISPYQEEALPYNFEKLDPLASDIVFTAQVVRNSCATLALLAVLLNANINKGPILNSFLEYTQGFSPIDRGMCLGYHDQIRSIHHAYASNAYQLAEDAMDVSTAETNENYEILVEDNYHYISYIYNNGYIWELDGLKWQPLRLSQCTHDNWIAEVKPIIQERMQDRMDVSMMAITRDDYAAKLKQKNAYEFYLQLSEQAIKKKPAKSTLARRKAEFFKIINEADPQHRDKMRSIWTSLSSQNYVLAETNVSEFAMDIDPFMRDVDQLTTERETAKANATRQKFDYFPFLREFFKASFQHGLLHDTSNASTRKSARRRQKRYQ